MAELDSSPPQSSSDAKAQRLVDPPRRWQQDPRARFAEVVKAHRKKRRFLWLMIVLGLVAHLIAVVFIALYVSPPGMKRILRDRESGPVDQVAVAIGPVPKKGQDQPAPHIDKEKPKPQTKVDFRATKAFVTTVGAPIGCVAFHPRSHAFCAGYGKSLTLWEDPEKPVAKWTIDLPAPMRRCVFLPQRKVLAVFVMLKKHGELRLYNTANGNSAGVLSEKCSSVSDIQLSMDERLLAIVERGKRTIRILHLDQSNRETLLPGHGAPVIAASFTQNGKELISYGLDKMIAVWDVAAGKVIRSASVSQIAAPRNAHLLPEHRTIIGTDRKRLFAWHWEKQTMIFESRPDAKTVVHSLAVDGNGELGFVGRMKLGINDKFAVDVVHFGDKKIVASLVGHRSMINCLALSSDGRFLLTSGGFDKTLHLWRLEY